MYEVQSDFLFRVLRAYTLKQATQTEDGSQSFHNASTKVGSVTYVYVHGQWVCVCIPVALSTRLPLCFEV